MKKISLIYLALIVVVSVGARRVGFPESSQIDYEIESELLASKGIDSYYFNQKVSHFNYKMAGKTFKQKYLMDSSNWNKENKGPIIMYCGNEGPI